MHALAIRVRYWQRQRFDRIAEAGWTTSHRCVHPTKLSLIRSERNGLF